METYYQGKPSKSRFLFLIIRDLFLSLIIIGIFMLIRDVWDHFSKKIYITDDGVMMKSGILRTLTKEVPFNNINTVSISQGVFGKILNFGDLHVNTGGDKPEIIFNHLHDPNRFKELINDKLVYNPG